MGKTKIILIVIAGIAAIAGGALFLIEDEHVAEGRKRFSYYCAVCHGGKGRGDGYNAANLDPQPRDLSDRKEAYMAKQKNEELFKVISSGGKAIDKSARMPPYGKTLSEKEIWEIIVFIRTLHSYKEEKVDFNKEMKTERPRFSVKKIDMLSGKKESKDLAMTVGDSESDSGTYREILRGGNLYKKLGCSACHRIADKGGEVGPELTNVGARLNDAWIYRFLKSPQSVIKEVKMPNYGLSDGDALLLTYYVLSLKKSAHPDDKILTTPPDK
jgi:mono/diheme cytochrome c family protein